MFWKLIRNSEKNPRGGGEGSERETGKMGRGRRVLSEPG